MKDNEQRDKRIADLRKAFEAVAVDAKQKGFGRGHGGGGAIPCPVCGTGTLKYSIASLKGHVWGACTTATCVRWMQ